MYTCVYIYIYIYMHVSLSLFLYLSLSIYIYITKGRRVGQLRQRGASDAPREAPGSEPSDEHSTENHPARQTSSFAAFCFN